ncbi:RPAP1-like protein [Tuber borchii]|uniref:RPAP1-like protein n=1 Tax=Tuber borchii TaxID=42251 RepID=A0A2T7A6E6_TUBBO|nr:RPAP1-like protein [Tuber borchii]
MEIPGERFVLPLDNDSQNDQTLAPQTRSSLIGDIVENTPDTTPTAPVLPPNASQGTGFPEHRNRLRSPSKFKQRVQGTLPKNQTKDTPAPGRTEKQTISDENEQRIANMSLDDIEKEQKELMEKLPPGLIERFLKKPQMGDGEVHGSFKNSKVDENESNSGPGSEPASEDQLGPSVRPKLTKRVTFENDLPPAVDDGGDDDSPPAVNMHFPKPTAATDIDELDPDSPEFLEKLHTKYFPSLPADPSRLAWMAPVLSEEDKSSYHPSQSDVPASALRFDFKGTLLPPRVSRELPGHLGLHHHADAPNAAGYTVPELAHLARSTFPTQRCMAIQTLGRILYRLGKGTEQGGYGIEEIVQGLWKCMAEGGVIEGLEEAAAATGGHMSVKAYATDALWLWQKGGGHRWKSL